jgi:hypothetical protein
VRATALHGLRQQIALAFDLDQSDPDVDAMARFALASLDGGFIASRADAGVTLAAIVQRLPAALIGIRKAQRVALGSGRSPYVEKAGHRTGGNARA